MNKQSTDLKMRVQKLETENARLEGNVSYFSVVLASYSRTRNAVYFFIVFIMGGLIGRANRARNKGPDA